MRARFSALLALFLACAPIASAQIVTPEVPYHSFVGTFNLVGGPSPATLTLTRNASGVVRGTYESPLFLINSTCRGDSNGPGFLITCTQADKPHIVISAAALPITLTSPDAPLLPQIRGYLYLVELSANQANTPMTEVRFSGRRV